MHHLFFRLPLSLFAKILALFGSRPLLAYEAPVRRKTEVSGGQTIPHAEGIVLGFGSMMLMNNDEYNLS